MVLTVTHTYVSNVAEGTDPTLVGPTEWNATHTVSGNIPVTQLNGGINATSATFWRGDGTWTAPVTSTPPGNVKSFGAKGDGQVARTNCTIAMGNASLSMTNSAFASGDVGKTILVPGAGPAGGDLVTTILAFTNVNTVVLSVTANTTLSAQHTVLMWGTDDTAAINTAIGTIATTGGALYFPAGTYIVTNGVLNALANPTQVLGDGNGSRYAVLGAESLIVSFSPTGTLFTCNNLTTNFRNIALLCQASTPTTSTGILVTNSQPTPQPGQEQMVNFESVTVAHFNINWDIRIGGSWVMHGCKCFGPTQYGMHIQNTVNNDVGDFAISDSTFNPAMILSAQANFAPVNVTSTAAILWESAGGGKITNSKFLGSFASGQGWNYGIEINNPQTTAQAFITHCSFDGLPTAAIFVPQTYIGLIVTDNFFHLPGGAFAVQGTNMDQFYIGGGYIEWFNNTPANVPINLTTPLSGTVGPIDSHSPAATDWSGKNTFPLLPAAVTGNAANGTSPGIPTVRDLSQATPPPLSVCYTVDPRIPGLSEIAINDSSVGGGANTMVFSYFSVVRPMIIGGVNWICGNSTGNFSIGIYRADGNVNPLIGGGTSVAISFTGIRSSGVGSISLYPGILYYAALALDNTTATFGASVNPLTDYLVNPIVTYAGTYRVASSFPCPQYASNAFPPAGAVQIRATPVLIMS